MEENIERYVPEHRRVWEGVNGPIPNDPEVHNALDKNGDLIVTCLFCHKVMVNPRIERGRIVQKFCTPKCHDAFHNKIKGGQTKEMIEFHAREILRLVGGYNE